MEGRYDVAQICMNGHVVNPSAFRFPHHNQQYCSECSQKTITACPSCNKAIRGAYVESFGDYERPSFCQECGAPFPWTAGRMEAAKALVDEIETISAEERESLKQSFAELITESARTELSAIRFKKLFPRISKEIGASMRSLLEEIICEPAKRLLWPNH